MSFPRKHLSKVELVQGSRKHVADERTNVAENIADIAEIDLRRIYLEEGYSSMFAYCVGEMKFSEDEAAKRIHVARKTRDFPVLLDLLADSRLHLTGARLLVPHLTHGNVDELIAAATHQTKATIEQLIARRFPQTEVLGLVHAIPAAPGPRHAPRHADTLRPDLGRNGTIGDAPGHASSQASEIGRGLAEEHAPGHAGTPLIDRASTEEHAPGHVQAAVPRSKVAPLGPERFMIQFTTGKNGNDLLRRAQELLSHSIPSGDIAQVFEAVFQEFVDRREKRKYGASTKPRPRRRSSSDPRRVPAHVRRAVWERDQGMCTFVGTNGHRCGSRKFLELDHIDPVARGGQATVSGLRLRCRAHNQYEADCIFGAGFMSDKPAAGRVPHRAIDGAGIRGELGQTRRE